MATKIAHFSKNNPVVQSIQGSLPVASTGESNSHSDSTNHMGLISDGQIRMLQEFVDFCKIKRDNSRHKKCFRRTKPVAHMTEISNETHISPVGSGKSGFNASYFSQVIGNLKPGQKDTIANHGFGSLLKFDNCHVPKRFVKWIARQVDVDESGIRLGDKFIPICKESVHIVLDIPIGGREIVLNSEAGKSFLMSKFQLTSVPSVSYFGDKLGTDNLPDDSTFSCFMIVALSCFLVPNSSAKPSTKYLHALDDIELVKEFDWAKFVYDLLMSSIDKFINNRKQSGRTCKALGGCIYFIAVYYFDFVNFGIHQVPHGVPRIEVWKQDMINLYSKHDQISSRTFGKRPIKELCNTCYAQIPFVSAKFCSGPSKPVDIDVVEFKNKIQTKYGHCLPLEVIEAFSDLLHDGIKSKKRNCCLQTMDSTILTVLQILSDASCNNSVIQDDLHHGLPHQISHSSDHFNDPPDEKPHSIAYCQRNLHYYFSTAKTADKPCDNLLVVNNNLEVSPDQEHTNLSSVPLVETTIAPIIDLKVNTVEILPPTQTETLPFETTHTECGYLSDEKSYTPTVIISSSDDSYSNNTCGSYKAKSSSQQCVHSLIAHSNKKCSTGTTKVLVLESPSLANMDVHPQPESIDNLMMKLQKPIINVDTPLLIAPKCQLITESLPIPANEHAMHKRRKHSCKSHTKIDCQSKKLFKNYNSDGEPPPENGNMEGSQMKMPCSHNAKEVHTKVITTKVNTPQASPEVKIVGEKKFTERCSEISKVADNMYDNMNIKTNASTRSAIILSDPIAKLHSRLQISIPMQQRPIIIQK